MARREPGAPDLSGATDAELLAGARRFSDASADVYLEALYRRFYPRVASWCVKTCRDREEAADLAQEVFLRIHSRLHTFRGESSFSTWVYTVMRSVAINRGLARQRRAARIQPVERPDESAGDQRDPLDSIELVEDRRRLRQAMNEELDPTEARVLYLHFVDGLTLHAITRLLGLRNKSGAKAFVVSGKRKLRRGLGRRKSSGRSMRECS